MEKFPYTGLKPNTRGYTPSKLILECFSLWYDLATDVIDQYNGIVKDYDARTRSLLGLPIINKEVWLTQFKQFLNSDFSDICTNCDKYRDALTKLSVPCGAQMWSPVLERFDDCYCEATLDSQCNREPYAVQAELFRLFNILWSFPRKLRVENEDINNKAKDKWIEFERTHPTFFQHDRYKDKLKSIIERWLLHVDLSVFPTKHGPGTTAEGIHSKIKKYSYLSLTPDQWRIANTYGVDLRGVPRKVTEHPPARVMLVPKKWSTPRVISAEPIGNQWLQQALMQILYRYYARHGYLTSRMNLFDQERNRNFCKIASESGEFATVDESAASDSLSYDIIKYLFKDTAIWDYMDNCRSKYTIAFGSVYKTQKFAPMGNGLCFPVESLVFAACCELACRESHVATQWSVYGDDIIIPVRAYSKLISILTDINVEVNRDKSFNTGFFRESCGVEYLHGYDVTPIYFKVASPISEKHVKPSVFQSCITLINRLGELRLVTCRRTLIRIASSWRYAVNQKRRQYKNVVLPLSQGNSAQMIKVSATPSVKWKDLEKSEYHRPCQRCTAVHVKERVYSGSASQPLYDWLAQRAFSPYGEELQVDPYGRKAEGTCLRTGWTYDPSYWADEPDTDEYLAT